MSRTKPTTPDAFNLLSERVTEAADVLKAMASDTRLKLLCALNETEMPVNQLAELTNQSSSAVSQHLAKLRAAGLVESRRDAQTIYYRCSGGVGRALVNTLCEFYR
jgi:DNA-binding transcriptional ArsR family regulator